MPLVSSPSSCSHSVLLGVGVIRRNFDVQATLCPLTSLGIDSDCCPYLNSSMVIVPSLLNSYNLEVTMALSQTMVVFSSYMSSSSTVDPQACSVVTA